MTKKLLFSGVLGSLVMFVVLAAFRIFLPSLGNYGFRPMPDQGPLQAALKARISEPTKYVCPYLPENMQAAVFPDYWNEPVFTVTYTGHTHSKVPGFSSVGILAFLLAPIAAAWLLAHASDKVLATYPRRTLFVASFGLFLVVSTDLVCLFTGDLESSAVAGFAVIHLVTWALAGLVLARIIRPETAAA